MTESKKYDIISIGKQEQLSKGVMTMKLELSQVKEITRGAAQVYEENGEIIFRRFTDEETNTYRIYRDDVYRRKTYTTAGIRLAFVTDSKEMSFGYRLTEHPWRPFGYFDVTVDGVMVLHEGVEKGEGDGQVCIPLGDGEKTVELWFPWSKGLNLSDITLDDGAFCKPKKRSRTMINYGDSITHGYDSIHPSLSYACQLANVLDADQTNKAIGGDRFFPELLEVDNGIKEADIITIAYGTNDWAIHTKATVETRSRQFIKKLSQMYPTAKIFVISPIWRRNYYEVLPKFGDNCGGVHKLLTEICEDIPNATVINGLYLTPHVLEFYTDGLHPNDLGMCVYAKNLADEIKKQL